MTLSFPPSDLNREWPTKKSRPGRPIRRWPWNSGKSWPICFDPKIDRWCRGRALSKPTSWPETLWTSGEHSFGTCPLLPVSFVFCVFRPTPEDRIVLFGTNRWAGGEELSMPTWFSFAWIWIYFYVSLSMRVIFCECAASWLLAGRCCVFLLWFAGAPPLQPTPKSQAYTHARFLPPKKPLGPCRAVGRLDGSAIVASSLGDSNPPCACIVPYLSPFSVLLPVFVLTKKRKVGTVLGGTDDPHRTFWALAIDAFARRPAGRNKRSWIERTWFDQRIAAETKNPLLGAAPTGWGVDLMNRASTVEVEVASGVRRKGNMRPKRKQRGQEDEIFINNHLESSWRNEGGDCIDNESFFELPRK